MSDEEIPLFGYSLWVQFRGSLQTPLSINNDLTEAYVGRERSLVGELEYTRSRLYGKNYLLEFDWFQ